MANITQSARRLTPASELFWAVSDTLVLIQRSLRHIARSTEQLLYVVVLPINLLLVFRYVLGGAINSGDIPYVNFMIAGVLVQSMMINASSTAVSVSSDVQQGIISRFRSMPMQHAAVLTGPVMANLVRNLLSALIVILAGLLVGFRPAAGVAEWAAVLAIALLFSVAMAWVGAVVGLLVNSVDAASGFSFVFIFLPYLSSAYVPTGHMPAVLRFVAENQPVTAVVEALRALMLGLPLGDYGWLAAAWWVAIAVVSYAGAAWLFERKSAR
jgi:ABC-2 type transport system permease protein